MKTGIFGFNSCRILKVNKMKKNKIYIILALGAVLLHAGCEYDNFDEPNAILNGRVVYEGEPVGVRTNGPQLELWQDGYALDYHIPVHIAHDGSYSVSLFKGEYKMVIKNGGPWLPELNDTIVVRVDGETLFDVPVTPYYTIENESFQKTGNSISASFTIEKIADEGDIQSVNLYLGKSILTDQNRKEYAKQADLSDMTIGEEFTLTADDIPENLLSEGYLFVRIGVRSTLSNEFYYTQVQKIEL